jgi:hypothetical protein
MNGDLDEWLARVDRVTSTVHGLASGDTPVEVPASITYFRCNIHYLLTTLLL